MGFGARMGTMGATRWSAKCCGYTAERANKGGERPEAIIEPAIAKTARTGSREALDVEVQLELRQNGRHGGRFSHANPEAWCKTRSTDIS